jgi:hypothetical protein
MEHDPDRILPARAEVGLQHGDRVQVSGRNEPVRCDPDGVDPIHPVRADGPGVVGVAEQIPPSVTDHHRPRVHLGVETVGALAAVGDPDTATVGDSTKVVGAASVVTPEVALKEKPLP